MAPLLLASMQQRSTLGRVAGVLFAFGAVMLLLEASSLDYRHYSSRLFTRRNGRDLSGARDLAAMDLDADDGRDDATLPLWLQKQHDDRDVPADELMHLSLLHAACLAFGDAVIPWTYGAPGVNQENDADNAKVLLHRDDPDLLERLRQCPEIDIFIPTGLRGHGYCEDAVVYAKFLESRLLPQWALEIPLFDANLNRSVTYHELCPRTPMLFFNHYWNGVPDSPLWPKEKPVYLMPNIEMFELNEEHYWRVDVVLCKTRDCEQRLRKWYVQEGNPRNAKVVYTRHSSSDLSTFAERRLGADAVQPKDYANVRFVHTVGTSGWKGTRQVLDCWLSRPEFPQLDLYVEEQAYKRKFEAQYGERILASHQVNLTSHRTDATTFGRVIAEASFFLCTSVMEGYGHYINQARASGGVIVTTNAAPMNELIGSSDSGVYVNTTLHRNPNIFLAGASQRKHGLKNVEGMSAAFSGDDVCHAVEHVLHKMSVAEREAMAANARRQYHRDTKFFARKMRSLRRFASQQGAKKEPLDSTLLRQDQTRTRRRQ